MDRNHPTHAEKPVTDTPVDGRNLQHDDALDAVLPVDGGITGEAAAVDDTEDGPDAANSDVKEYSR